MLGYVLAVLLAAASFCGGIEYAKYAERKACDARVSTMQAAAQSFYKVELNAMGMVYQNRYQEAVQSLAEQYNALIKKDRGMYRSLLMRVFGPPKK